MVNEVGYQPLGYVVVAITLPHPVACANPTLSRVP
jgi:hypothetical protein